MPQPLALALVQTTHIRMDDLFSRKGEEQGGTHFIPIQRTEGGWRVDTSDFELLQKIRILGLHGLFLNYNILFDEDSFMNARAESARQREIFSNKTE